MINLTDWREAIGHVAVSHVSDAMGRIGVPPAIWPLNPKTTMLGTAYTVRAWPGDNLALHYALKHAQPGQVLVVDGGGRSDIALWGELMSLCAKERDLGGIVVDGAVRDRDALAKMDFPVYARACTPRGPVKVIMGEVNCPVNCDGVAVQPGDLIYGDADGVVVVPKQQTTQVLVTAQAIAAKEVWLQQQIKAGEVLFDILALDKLMP